jgi:hypothetical protein
MLVYFRLLGLVNFVVIVANMTSYAICSSLILVIHDNMTNGTNYSVERVSVGISRSHGCENTTCQNEKIIYILRV